MKSQVKAPAYLIHGVFFQEGDFLGIDMVAIMGAVAVVRHATIEDMFAGMIWRDEVTGEWTGQMIDSFGSSTLSCVEFDDSTLRFTKTYERRRYDIDYQFTLQNGLWMGSYWGDLVGSGNANCTVAPLPEQMFQNSP